MTTPFVSYAFPATGAPINRTVPDRWADWHNVKEFGAVGNGIADDTAAIQAAVNWTASDNRGMIYFPRGTYKVSAPIILPIGNGSINFCFVGDGGASNIIGNVNGFIFIRKVPTYDNPFTQLIAMEKLTITNLNTGSNTGAIYLGSTAYGVARDCTISGVLGLILNENDIVPPVAAFANASSFPFQVQNCKFVPLSGGIIAGSCGIATGNQGAVTNCVISGFNRGLACIGSPASVIVLGGRISDCNYGVYAGGDQLGNSYAAGVTLRGVQLINNNIAGLHTNPASVTAAGLRIVGNGGQYGIFCEGGGATSQSSFLGCVVSGSYSVAAIAINDGPAQSGGAGDKLNTFVGCRATNSGPGVAWQMPVNAPSAKFVNCNNTDPSVTFLTLPSAVNPDWYQPVIGDEYLISDSPTPTVGNFATVVTVGGSSNKVRLRWNGTQWIIV